MNVRNAVRTSLATLAITAGTVAATPALQAQWGLSVNVNFSRMAPPPLRYVDQTVAPGDGYLWTPGYWAWDADAGDYYWVDGQWVLAPEPGLLWTPGYWAFENSGYLWHAGYWGPQVGFYGGVNYGFGYFGTGYEGGYWSGNRFFYNTAVNRVDLRFVHNTFVRPVAPEFTNRGNVRVSFNGGPGGMRMQPNRDEQMAMQERHFAPAAPQRNEDGGNRDRGFGNGQGFQGDRGRNDGNHGGNAFNGGSQSGQPGAIRWIGPGDGSNRPNPANPPRRDFPTENGGVRGNDPAQGHPAESRPAPSNDGGHFQQPQSGNRFGGESFGSRSFGGDRPTSFGRQPENHSQNSAPSGMRGFGRF